MIKHKHTDKTKPKRRSNEDRITRSPSNFVIIGSDVHLKSLLLCHLLGASLSWWIRLAFPRFILFLFHSSVNIIVTGEHRKFYPSTSFRTKKLPTQHIIFVFTPMQEKPRLRHPNETTFGIIENKPAYIYVFIICFHCVSSGVKYRAC